MKVLTLDFGNSFAHAALFSADQIIEQGTLADVFSWFKKHNLTYGDVSGVLSSVKNYDEDLALHLKEGLLIDRVKDYWKGGKFAGMPVNYAHSLGEDRLISAWYCFKVLKKPILHISAGTFFTVDIIDDQGFQGGYILPGLCHQLAALNKGEQLEISKISASKDLLSLSALPHSTDEALQGIFVSYSQFILKLCQLFNIESIVLNGGAAEITKSLLQPLLNGIEINLDPQLNHRSLYEWYRRNICL